MSDMRSVVLMMSTSVDGFVVGPHGHAGGLPEPEPLRRWKLDRIRRAGTHVMGRVTYQEMAAHWPTSDDEYAAPMNEIPKVVFSRTLAEAAWTGSSVARGDLAAEIDSLRRRPGGEIIAWGGAGFAQALSQAGLVDQYVLAIRPVVYGGGLPMFRDLSHAMRLALIEARTFDDGTALHVYVPSPERPPARRV
jgi:dihydrofolate reductase